jgi:enoyl-CoA hydratase/carnithine racemase/ketosteroid isomerase-like protein
MSSRQRGGQGTDEAVLRVAALELPDELDGWETLPQERILHMRGFEAWNRGDVDAWVARFSPDCEFRSLPDLQLEGEEGGIFRGHAALREWHRRTGEVWGELRLVADRAWRRGRRLILAGRLQARGRTSGAAVEMPMVWLAERNSAGQAVWGGQFSTVEEALEAARRRDSASLTSSAQTPTAGAVPPREVSVEVGEDLVATVEIHRPPNNYIDVALASALAEAYEALDRDPACRAIVLCSEGKHFCAGAALTEPADRAAALQAGDVYRAALRMFSCRLPVVAAVQGAAVGGGLGLALSADFRVASPETRMWPNFARLGFHHGFGMTVTLPAVVGPQRALELLLTGRRVSGEEALALGLCDRLTSAEQLRAQARALAAEIASSAPLAVASIRETLRGDLVERIRLATEREAAEQARLMQTEDFREGVRATAERRAPRFSGR